MTWFSRLLRRPPRLDMHAFAPVPAGGYLVGGALRDALLGRPFADIDWLVPDPERAAREAADALPGSVFPLDAPRGHWRVVTEGAVRDYIRLEGALEADLRSRDFTVNALAADREGGLVDPLGGLADLRRRRLRMTGEGALRADPLRLLRAVRLSVALEFTHDPATADTLRTLALELARGELPLPAWERSREELDRILLERHAGRGMLQLDGFGLLPAFLPELAAGRGVAQGGFHHLDVLAHGFEALDALVRNFPDADLTLRWATLLHDVGKPETRARGDDGRIHFYGHAQRGEEITRRLLRRLRQPSARVARAGRLVRYHMLPLPKSDKEARRFVHRRRELLPDLLKLMIADREAARGPLSSEGSRRAYRTALSRVLALLDEPPPTPPLLDGREVMELLGLPPGPEVGEALRFVREAEAIGDLRSRAEAVTALERYARAQGWLGEVEGERAP